MIDNEEVRREVDDLKAGRVRTVREFALVGSATSTTVIDRLCSSNSVVLPQALSALATNAAIVRIVPGNQSFVVHHTSSADARTYRYTLQTAHTQL